jgi:hypothetical protein
MFNKFLTSELDGGECSTSRLAPWEEPRYQDGPQTRLDAVAERSLALSGEEAGSCVAAMSVCDVPVSCIAAGQNAGRVTHEPDRAQRLSSCL